MRRIGGMLTQPARKRDVMNKHLFRIVTVTKTCGLSFDVSIE